MILDIDFSGTSQIQMKLLASLQFPVSPLSIEKNRMGGSAGVRGSGGLGVRGSGVWGSGGPGVWGLGTERGCIGSSCVVIYALYDVSSV